MEWEPFEDAHQLVLAPLLTNRGYDPSLRATNSVHERMLRELAAYHLSGLKARFLSAQTREASR